MDLNILKLTRFNGEEIFEITEASIYYSYEDALLSLDFRTGKCISPLLEDTNERGGVSGEFWIYDLEISNLKELEGSSFYIKDGYKNDNPKHDTCSSFYYWEHQPISENTIEFIKFTEDFIQVKTSANTCDVNWCDGSKPETKIEIFAEFKYEKNHTNDSTAIF
ncbi:MAG: hypothetical protein GY810_27305 [Aureispira sp.]|nr:hypothetical protein [Aureispira sp.]